MYLHLGNETVVKTRDIIGIFDLDTSTVAKSTRDFLSTRTKNKEVVNVTYELPKSFILVKGKKSKNQKVYISQLATTTLNKRNKISSK